MRPTLSGVLRRFRKALHRVFPSDVTGEHLDDDPSGDARASATQVKGQSFGNTGDPVPGAVPPNYVKSYDEGRPRH
jgi:hypothetical protein